MFPTSAFLSLCLPISMLPCKWGSTQKVMQQFVWGYRGPNIGPTDTNKSDCFVYQPIPLGCELLKKGSSAHSYNSFLILAVTTAQVLGKLFIILIQSINLSSFWFSINLSLCKVERRGSGLDSGLALGIEWRRHQDHASRFKSLKKPCDFQVLMNNNF